MAEGSFGIEQKEVAKNQVYVEKTPAEISAEARTIYATFEALPVPKGRLMTGMKEEELPPVFRNLTSGARSLIASEEVILLPKTNHIRMPVVPDSGEEIVRIVRGRSPVRGDAENQRFSSLYDESIVETAQMLERYVTDREFLLDRHGTDHRKRRQVKALYRDEYDKEGNLIKSVAEADKKKFAEYMNQVLDVNGFRGYAMTAAITGMQAAEHFKAVNPKLAEVIVSRGLQLQYLRSGDREHGLPSYEDMTIEQRVALARMTVSYCAQGLRDMLGEEVPTRSVAVL